MSVNNSVYGARPFENSLGDRIKELREERGESQADLAAALNLSQRATIEQWEKGTRFIKAAQLAEIARHFNVSADYLLSLSDVQTQDTELRAVCEYTGLSENTINRIIGIRNLYSRYGGGATESIDDLVSHRQFYQVISGITNGRKYANLMKEQIKTFTLTVDRLISDGQREKAVEMLNSDDIEKIFHCCTQFKLMRFDASEFATEIISDILQYQSGIDAINDFDEYVNTRSCELEDALSEILKQFDDSANLTDGQEG